MLFRSMAASAASVGFLASLFTPIGPIGGTLAGLGVGLAAGEGRFHDFLFGKKDENGKITIDDVAAGEDIRKIERAQSILQNALQSLRAAQTEGANSKGETAQAIYDKSQELINQIQRLDSNLEETTNYIRHVLAVYKAKDEMLKEIMAAAQNMN
mgnify:CR=1 FL=1